jgi:hypothetical protein
MITSDGVTIGVILTERRDFFTCVSRGRSAVSTDCISPASP